MRFLDFAPKIELCDRSQAFACDGWGLDPPVLLPAPGSDKAISLQQVPRDGQQ